LNHDQQIQQDSHGAIESVFGSSADPRAMIRANFRAARSGMLQQHTKITVHFSIEFNIGQKIGSNRFQCTAEI